MQRRSRNNAKRCKLEIVTEIKRPGGIKIVRIDCRHTWLVACAVIMAELGPPIPLRGGP